MRRNNLLNTFNYCIRTSSPFGLCTLRFLQVKGDFILNLALASNHLSASSIQTRDLQTNLASTRFHESLLADFRARPRLMRRDGTAFSGQDMLVRMPEATLALRQLMDQISDSRETSG